MTSTDPNQAPAPAPSIDPSSTSEPDSAPMPPAAPPPSSPRRRASVAGWIVALALASLIGALLFVGGYLAAGGNNTAACSAPAPAFASLCDAYQKLKSEYVDPLDDSKLAEGAIQGMFQFGVADPFSGYMAPTQYQQALGDLSGKFSGIGAEMSVKNVQNPTDLASCTTLSDACVLVVVSPISGSPAEKAGLQPGDIVTAVDGTSVNGSTVNDQITKVRGQSGTKVTLTIKRGEQTFDVAITRSEITMKEVETKLIDGHIGYIALHGFSDSSPDQFKAGLKSLLDQGADQIVFDLRDNPGGYILSAQKIASQFVSSGTIFTQESAGGEVKTWTAEGGGLATDPKIPLVVLVNGGSASASEIVSAALKELGRATIIGEHTYGKNTVQVWAPLENGGGVRITISRWFPPNHDSVHPDGVQPDIAVAIPAGTPPEKDLILDRAVAYLGSLTGTGPAPTPVPSPAQSTSPGAAALAPVDGFSTLMLSWDGGGLTHAYG
jgi:carboxyl-terminal processing protease